MYGRPWVVYERSGPVAPQDFQDRGGSSLKRVRGSRRKDGLNNLSMDE